MILSIDLGSTTFKAGVFDAACRLRGEGDGILEYRSGSYSDFMLPAEHVVVVFKSCIAAALKAAETGSEQITGIAITGQAQTFCLADRQGQPLTPFISWRDTRSVPLVEAMGHLQPWNNLREHCTFPEMISGLQVSSFLHLLNSRQLPRKKDFILMPLHSYLAFLLSGAWVTDDNMAAMTGFYSLTQHDWWQQSLKCCELSPSQFPAVIPPGKIAAKTKLENIIGLPAGINIHLAGNDQTAGAFGAGITLSDLYLSLGTAYVAYGIFTSLPDARSRTARGTYYGGKYYRLSIANHGGHSLTELVKHFADGDFMRFFEREIHQSQAKAALAEIIDDLSATIALIGIEQPRRLLVSGGGNRSPGMLRLLTEATGLQVEPSPSGPLTGAAMAVQTAIG